MPINLEPPKLKSLIISYSLHILVSVETRLLLVLVIGKDVDISRSLGLPDVTSAR